MRKIWSFTAETFTASVYRDAKANVYIARLREAGQKHDQASLQTSDRPTAMIAARSMAKGAVEAVRAKRAPVKVLVLKTVPQLKKGDVVCQYGGRFLVTDDAREAGCSGMFFHGKEGPNDCAVAPSLCLEGEVEGYFKPGCDWTQQGNYRASVYVEA